MLFSRILHLCQIHNITINALEKATGIKKGTIQKWKVSVPMTNNLVIVADYFGVSVDYLLGRSNNSQSHKDPGIFKSAIQQVAEIIKNAEQEIQNVLDSCNSSSSDAEK